MAEEIEPFAEGAAAVDFLAANFGPLMKLHGMLAAQGKWEQVRVILADSYDGRIRRVPRGARTEG